MGKRVRDSQSGHSDVSRVAAIYLRVSSPGQEDNYSLETQEQLCRAYCTEQGYTVAQEHVYRDGAQRSYTLDRPALEQLREAIRAGRIGVVVALVFDRLSRDQVQQGVLIYEFDRYGTRLEFVLEQFDDTPLGRFMRSSMGFVAEVERERIRERSMRGRKARARDGKLVTGAFPLYGYRWKDPDKGQRTAYIPDPETAPIIQRIFRDVAAGVPIQTLCAQLEAEGVPTPGQVLRARGMFAGARQTVSSLWRPATIRRFLIHPAYSGQHAAYRWRNTVWRERDRDTGIMRELRKPVERALDDEERILLPPEVCPALIDEETALAVRARLLKNAQEAVRHHQEPEATLLRSGYIFCGHCGRKLYTHRVHGEWRYSCNSFRLTPEMPSCPGRGTSISAFIIDPIVWGHVRRVLLNPQHLTRALEQWEQDNAQQGGRAAAHAAAVEGQLATLQAKAANLSQAIAEAATGEARTILTSTLDRLSKDITVLASEREVLRADAIARADMGAQLHDLEAWAGTLAGHVDAFTHRQKRTALYALGVRVKVWRKDHTPRFEVTFNFEGLNAGLTDAMLPLTENPGNERDDDGEKRIGTQTD